MASNLKKVRREPIFIEIGDKTRRIKFDMNSFAELEKKYGTVQAAMDAMSTGSVLAAGNMLWAGLIHEEAVLGDDGEPIGYNISPYLVRSWVDSDNMEEVIEKLTKAMGGDNAEQIAKAVAKESADVNVGNAPKLQQ